MVRLLFLRDALLVVLAPQVNQRHVLPVSHLFMNRPEIRFFIIIAAVVCAGIMSIHQLVYTIVGDAFRKRKRYTFTPFESTKEVIDSRFTCVIYPAGNLAAA